MTSRVRGMTAFHAKIINELVVEIRLQLRCRPPGQLPDDPVIYELTTGDGQILIHKETSVQAQERGRVPDFRVGPLHRKHQENQKGYSLATFAIEVAVSQRSKDLEELRKEYLNTDNENNNVSRVRIVLGVDVQYPLKYNGEDNYCTITYHEKRRTGFLMEKAIKAVRFKLEPNRDLGVQNKRAYPQWAKILLPKDLLYDDVPEEHIPSWDVFLDVDRLAAVLTQAVQDGLRLGLRR